MRLMMHNDATSTPSFSAGSELQREPQRFDIPPYLRLMKQELCREPGDKNRGLRKLVQCLTEMTLEESRATQ